MVVARPPGGGDGDDRGWGGRARSPRTGSESSLALITPDPGGCVLVDSSRRALAVAPKHGRRAAVVGIGAIASTDSPLPAKLACATIASRPVETIRGLQYPIAPLLA